MTNDNVSTANKTKSSFFGLIFCTAIIILAAIFIQLRDELPLREYQSRQVASTKPFSSFAEFYPYYLGEHSQKITRQWHYLGNTLVLLYLLTNPLLIFPILSGVSSAYAVMPFTRHIPSGLPEAIVFLIVYVIGGKSLHRSFRSLFLPLIVGYGCSWIGHFAFEENKPAAFTYPTYSVFGDFHMAYDAVVQQRF